MVPDSSSGLSPTSGCFSDSLPHESRDQGVQHASRWWHDSEMNVGARVVCKNLCRGPNRFWLDRYPCHDATAFSHGISVPRPVYVESIRLLAPKNGVWSDLAKSR